MTNTLDHFVVGSLGLLITAYLGHQRVVPNSPDPGGSLSWHDETSTSSSEYNPPPPPARPGNSVPSTPPVQPPPPQYQPPPTPQYQPPPNTQEPATCRLVTGPNHITRSADLGSGLFLQTNGRQVGIGWIVPPRRRPGPEDVSFAWLRADGALDTWVTQNRPSPQRDVGDATSLVAQAVPVITDSGMLPRVDRRYFTSDGRWHCDCGEIGNVYASMVQSEPDLPPVRTADWSAMFWCRTATIAHNPFVLAARPVLAAFGSLQGEVMLYGTREADAPAPADTWRLRFDPAVVARASDPTEALRNAGAPSKVSFVETPQGYGVSFIHHSRLYLGWLDANLGLRGPLRPIRGQGSTPGHATMQWNGREVVMVFADRPDSHSLYGLWMVRASFGEDPPTPSRVQTVSAPVESEFAPALARMPDGNIVLSWTYGRDGVHEGANQNVYVGRYDDVMNPRGGALWLATGADSSEVVGLENNRAVVVAMTGNGVTREVTSFALDCGP